MRSVPPVLRAALVSSLVVSCAASSGSVVRRVEVVGAESFDVDDLVDGLGHHPPRGFLWRDRAAFDKLALSLDRQRITSYFASRGYFEARVVSVEVEPYDGHDLALRIVVDVGAPSRVVAVRFGGFPEDAPPPSLEGLVVGEPFVHAEYRQAKARLLAWLYGRGYAHARLEGEARVDRAAHRVEVVFVADPGPRCVFGEVRVEGLERAPRSLVTHRVAFAPGDPFDPERLELTRGRIYETGLLGNVRFDWDRARRASRVDVDIHASEVTPRELRLGLGLGFEPNFLAVRTRAAYTHRGFLDPLLTARVSVQPGYAFGGQGDGADLEGQASIERADFLFPRVSASIGGGYRLTELEAYSTRGPTADLGFGRPLLDDRLVLGASFALASHDVRAPLVGEADRARFGIFDPLTTFTFAPRLYYEGRDDPLRPTRGFVVRLDARIGQALSGPMERFVVLSPELRGYLPVLPRTVLAGRARFAAALTPPGAVPITERLFAGGADSHRGFGRHRLAPFVAGPSGSLALGGEALLELSAELRVEVVRVFGQWLAVAGFVDAAEVAPSVATLDPAALHVGTGGGLRLHTPVGAVRVDVGVRLNRRGATDPDPDAAWAFHLGLGEAF